VKVLEIPQITHFRQKKIGADEQIGYFLKLPKLTIKIRLNNYE
jgi:hypothetical protein